MNLHSKYISTPLGMMKAVANDQYLLLLDFEGSKYIDKHLPHNCIISDNDNHPILNLVEKELQLYFKGLLKTFSIPILLSGTEFQQQVWNELLKIPYGTTISYQQQSENINNPKAIRAVANANSKNKISIIVPCHRVIGKDKSLTGYAGGLEKKEFLLNLELKNK